MREWILIRHGESEDNAGVIRHCNSCLTPKGITQAIEAANAIGSKPDFDLIVSPYLRTVQTAEIVGKVSGGPALFDDNLREFAESCVVGGSQFPQETHRQFFIRIFRLLVTHADRPRVIAVTHGGVVATLSQIFVNKQPDARTWGGVSNCEIRRFSVGEETIRWVKSNLSELHL